VVFAARSATGVTIDLLAEHAWSWRHRMLAAGEPFSVSFELPLVKRQPVAALVSTWAETNAVVALDVQAAEGQESVLIDGPGATLELGFRSG
jgi:hypothetical protein